MSYRHLKSVDRTRIHHLYSFPPQRHLEPNNQCPISVCSVHMLTQKGPKAEDQVCLKEKLK